MSLSGEHPPVRPTRRCLEDLGLKVPSLRIPLETLDHNLLEDAQFNPERHAAGGLKRIVKVKDRVWFKSRVSRWRGASTVLAEHEVPAELADLAPKGRWWLGAGGWREAGSKGDFYSQFEAEASEGSHHLLPTDWDVKRLTLEQALAWEQHLEHMVLDIVATSLRCGRIVEAEYRHHRVAALVRADNAEEAYVVICAEGVPDGRVIALILDSVPGLSRDDWMAEPGHVSGIEPATGQIVFSAVFPPSAAAAVLEAAGDSDS